MKIPSLILKQLYTMGSLENIPGGAQFALKNRLSDTTLIRVSGISIDGAAVPLDTIRLEVGGETLSPGEVTADQPVDFPLRKQMIVKVKDVNLEIGKHTVGIDFEAGQFGRLSFEVKDAIREYEG